MFIESQADLPPGTDIELSFKLPGGPGTQLNCSAVISTVLLLSLGLKVLQKELNVIVLLKPALFILLYQYPPQPQTA